MVKFRKKFKPEEANKLINHLHAQLENEYEFLMTYNVTCKDKFIDIFFEQEGGWEGHLKKVQDIIEKIKYLEQFIKGGDQ